MSTNDGRLTLREWATLAANHYFPSWEDRAEARAWSQGVWADGAYRAHLHNEEHGTATNEIGGIILNAWDAATYPFVVTWCQLFGHALTDDSYGGPDSGTMGVRCTRCQWSHSTVLY